mgnify:CR=1 FL=1
MARKSKIKRLPPEQRQYIEKLLREDRLTLDEMLDAIRAEFPQADAPSRSSLGRYKQAVAAVTERMRGQREVARIIVGELGENPDDKSGEMLVQTITALASDVALRAAGQEDVDIEQVRKLSRAVKDIIAARSRSLKERQEIERLAEERLVRAQRKKLEALGKSGAVPADMLKTIIKAAYDLE